MIDQGSEQETKRRYAQNGVTVDLTIFKYDDGKVIVNTDIIQVEGKDVKPRIHRYIQVDQFIK